ncbi:hypothetical protein QYF36_006599 [Acer negundo]|nr:hypothetical protein QYF36_006599 [Acer negundo]
MEHKTPKWSIKTSKVEHKTLKVEHKDSKMEHKTLKWSTEAQPVQRLKAPKIGQCSMNGAKNKSPKVGQRSMHASNTEHRSTSSAQLKPPIWSTEAQPVRKT